MNIPILPALRRFIVYVKALALSRLLYAIPVRGTDRDQLHRATGSVTRNIAEGASPRSLALQNRYFEISRSSLWEIASVLDSLIARNRTPRNIEEIASLLCEVDAMLLALLRRR